MKLNTDPTSSAGAELNVRKNNALVQHFDSQSPASCWIRDSFCPNGANGPECVNYQSQCSQPAAPLDLQWRSANALQLNAIGFGNHITAGPTGVVQFDDIVVATQRVGCL